MRMTRSTASLFIRQYSTAWSASRATSSWSTSEMAHEDDRQIAGYAEGHRLGCPPLPLSNGLRRWTQRRRGVDDVPGQTLVLSCLAPVDAEVVQLHLGLGPGERGGALERADVVVLVDQIEDVLARRGDHRPEIDARRRSWRDPHPTAQGEDRIEHRPGRAR